MEIAKFVFTAVGTFLSVFTLSFAVFQYWRKKQDEKMELFRTSLEKMVRGEGENRRESEDRLRRRIEKPEDTVAQRFENRLSVMEGELKGIKGILQQINNWFINNSGGKQ